MIKRTLLLVAAVCSAIPLHGVAQVPATPAPLAAPGPLIPPVPPAPLAPDHPTAPRPTGRNQSGVFLGVETTRVPSALSDQLNLPDGFGLLVDYVVPGSAADTAGVKAHDILKMLNDQILTSEEQLAVLVRSFPDGQVVVLVVLRKGQETKLSAKLQTRPSRGGDHPAGRELRFRREGRDNGNDGDFHFDFGDVMDPGLGDRIQASIDRSSAQVEAATARANEEVRRAMETVRERTTRATGSRLDVDDARILMRDSTGRIEIRSARGKRTLTVRDADSKNVFEGPIDTAEQRKAIPANVLPQVESLEREQAVTFPKRSGGGEDDDSKRVD